MHPFQLLDSTLRITTLRFPFSSNCKKLDILPSLKTSRRGYTGSKGSSRLHAFAGTEMLPNAISSNEKVRQSP
jgi:hypothetical protein